MGSHGAPRAPLGRMWGLGQVVLATTAPLLQTGMSGSTTLPNPPRTAQGDPRSPMGPHPVAMQHKTPNSLILVKKLITNFETVTHLVGA